MTRREVSGGWAHRWLPPTILTHLDELTQMLRHHPGLAHDSEKVTVAWPDWLRKAGGKAARIRPSQDLRLLQYTSGANFKPHVDSGWALQALIYLNEDFQGGFTGFPNLSARYRPRRGRALLWRNAATGHKPAVATRAHDDHPSLHVAGPVHKGTKRVVSINLVLA